LSDGSGAVYRFGDPGAGSEGIPLVVKFSRFGQDVHFERCPQLSASIAPHRLNDLAFNDPFQEFGMLDELRHGEYGPRNLRILTKRPLAIYSTGRTFNAWQLGRATHRFLRYRSQMDIDQKSQSWPLADEAFSIERQYVMLFHWVRGTDAESLVRQGLLSTREAAALVRSVNEDLARKGFCMLDLKPNHVILRTHSDGRLVRRGRRPVYALVDFELLLRTEDHERWRTRRHADTEDWLRLPAQPVMNSAAASAGLA
jgi:hypothetical protein